VSVTAAAATFLSLLFATTFAFFASSFAFATTAVAYCVAVAHVVGAFFHTFSVYALFTIAGF